MPVRGPLPTVGWWMDSMSFGEFIVSCNEVLICLVPSHFLLTGNIHPVSQSFFFFFFEFDCKRKHLELGRLDIRFESIKNSQVSRFKELTTSEQGQYRLPSCKLSRQTKFCSFLPNSSENRSEDVGLCFWALKFNYYHGIVLYK